MINASQLFICYQSMNLSTFIISANVCTIHFVVSLNFLFFFCCLRTTSILYIIHTMITFSICKLNLPRSDLSRMIFHIALWNIRNFFFFFSIFYFNFLYSIQCKKYLQNIPKSGYCFFFLFRSFTLNLYIV